VIDNRKTASVMADALRGIIPALGTDKKYRDYIEHIYLDTISAVFSEFESMGIAGPVVEVQGDRHCGFPVYESKCFLFPDIEFPIESARFLINFSDFGVQVVVRLMATEKNGKERSVLNESIKILSKSDKCISHMTRQICMTLKHTEESIENIKKWFSGHEEEDNIWKPAEGESYVYIDDENEPVITEFSSDNPYDVERLESGNCYQDANEAMASRGVM
jgi:hypothetical protein